MTSQGPAETSHQIHEWQKLLTPEIKKFMTQNEVADVSKLALQKWPDPSWPKALILDQMKARQKAKQKLGPVVSAHVQDLILPAADVIEQASSYATASYKKTLLSGRTLVDLTAGSGTDALTLGENFENIIAVERCTETASRLAHNAKFLTEKPIEIICQDAEIYIKNMTQVDCVYIDPMRRDNQKKGFYNIFDGHPNVLGMMRTLQEKADKVMIKTSPMLDIEKGLALLPCVTDIHVVEWQGQCKEILWILDFNELKQKNTSIHAVILDDEGGALHHAHDTIDGSREAGQMMLSDPLEFLYEPSPAFQKTQLFHKIASNHGLKKLSPMTHLFTSHDLLDNFPGRCFKVLDIYPPHKKALPMKKANLTVRNFPASVEELRKTLNLKEGGNDYLFACTLKGGKKVIVHTRKHQN